MTPIIDSLRRPRVAAGLIALAAIATIAGALVFEHIFSLAPCPLCLRQRIPYYAAIPIALAAAVLPVTWARFGLALLALVFLVSAGLGLHHAGVEWGWWEGLTSCTATGAQTLEDILAAPVVRCDQVQFEFLGLSMAGWNAVVSLSAAGAIAWLTLRRR